MKFKRIAFIGATWPENELYCPHFVGVQAGFKKLGIDYRFITCRPRLNINQVIEYQPDLIIYGLVDMVRNWQWRNEIKKALPNAAIVMWYGDYRDERMTQPIGDCSEIDCMFVSNDSGYQKAHYKKLWKMRRVEFLPLGCEPVDEPMTNKKFAFDFVFIGAQLNGGSFQKRAREIEAFKQDERLTYVNSHEPDLRAKIYRSMPAIYSSSKVCLDISHFTKIDKYTSIRYWEIPAFYGFALTKRWPGCEEFYPESCRAYFDTYGEAVEKKNYYLKHETKRVAMLEKAHELSYNHSYDKRLLLMFKKI